MRCSAVIAAISGRRSARVSRRRLRAAYIPSELGAAPQIRANERIVFATDFPHPDAKYPKAVETFLKLPGIGRESQRKILWDNALNLYRFDRHPPKSYAAPAGAGARTAIAGMRQEVGAGAWPDSRRGRPAPTATSVRTISPARFSTPRALS